jgi:hypothetical protein
MIKFLQLLVNEFVIVFSNMAKGWSRITVRVYFIRVQIRAIGFLWLLF